MKNGDKICDEMMMERLPPDRTVGILTSVKKLQLSCFEKYLHKTPVKFADFWRKMAIISKSREIDCSKIISNHELTITPRCLTDRTLFFYSGHKGKSNFKCVLKNLFSVSLFEIDCDAVDRFDMLHLLQKTE